MVCGKGSSLKGKGTIVGNQDPLTDFPESSCLHAHRPDGPVMRANKSMEVRGKDQKMLCWIRSRHSLPSILLSDEGMTILCYLHPASGTQRYFASQCGGPV